jgi:hypothetical protein
MGIMTKSAIAAAGILLLPNTSAGSADTLTAEIEEGEFAEGSDMYALTFGAGCSLACGIGWIFEGSSELVPESGFTYEARNLGDTDRSTAWVEGVPGYGEGEVVTAVFCYGPEEGSVPFRSFTILNGYAKNDEAWESNGRVHLLEMRLNSETLFFIELVDSQQPQSVSWPKEILLKNDDILELEILSVYEGNSYDDTALTELIFWGAH